MNDNLENMLSSIQQKDASVLCREVTSIGDTMDVLRAKWNVEILTAILCGQTWFKDILASAKGISEIVLSDWLKQLTDDAFGVTNTLPYPFPADETAPSQPPVPKLHPSTKLLRNLLTKTPKTHPIT